MAVALIAGACSDGKPSEEENAKAAARATVARLNAEAAKQKAECDTGRDASLDKYKQLLSARQFWEASESFGPCLKLWADPKVTALAAEAKKLHYVAIAEDPKRDPFDRMAAISNLRPEFVAEADRLEPLRSRLNAQVEKQNEVNRKRADAADRAERKKQGVSLGMTPEEVLMSSWGKPERINRTTNARGTQEQWVYPGHSNYLYFDNGRLTSIQN